MNTFPPLEKRELPPPPHWTKAIGVGIVVMGLAMGTGELILWPHLVTKHGLGLLWLALIGITCQYFINQEVARYSLATGESFFTSSARILKWSPFFWVFAALLLYIWPGWASAIATTLRELFNFGSHLVWSWAVLGLVLIITFSGQRAYYVLERTLKIIVPSFFLILIGISFFNLTPSILKEGLMGVINFGYIPKDVDINVLLGAIVFAGAGGMLNLCVGLWYRDKQLGMSKHVGQITNPMTGKSEVVSTTGYFFEPTEENLKKWKGWMRYIAIDQGLIFWFLGFITLFLLSVNAYAVLTPKGLVPEGMNIAVVQAHIFGDVAGVVGFKLFLIMAFLMLFSVMWTVIDALTRIISDIVYTNSRIGSFQKYLNWFKKFSLSQLYYSIIVVIIVIESILVIFKQPLTFLVISGVLGGLTMAIYTPFLIYINNTRLPKQIRPNWFTNIIMISISSFYIFFSYKIIINYFA